MNIALGYFDASINRISAWTVGFRNLQRGLLFALLQPNETLTALQDKGDFIRLMMLQEELKTVLLGEIRAEYCRRCGVPEDGQWLDTVEKSAEIPGKVLSFGHPEKTRSDRWHPAFQP